MTVKEIADFVNLLAEEIDPETGEYLENNELLDIEIVRAISKLLETQSRLIGEDDRPNLKNWPSERVFEALKEWRLDMCHTIRMPAYIVFHDKTLLELAKKPILRKEDLLKIKGIGPAKYNAYADDLYDIMSSFYKECTSSEESAAPVIVTDNVDIITPIPEEDTVKVERSCKNCMLYRRGDCIGNEDPYECEYYMPAPTIDPEELKLWSTIETSIEQIKKYGYIITK